MKYDTLNIFGPILIGVVVRVGIDICLLLKKDYNGVRIPPRGTTTCMEGNDDSFQ